MKMLSFVILAASFTSVSCSTKRFADVAPETRGTALGEVVIGKENADYFVVPTRNSIGYQQEDPAAIVVFKTKERHPSYKAAKLAGAPMRTVNRVGSTVIGGVTDIAGALVTQPFQKQDAPQVAAVASSPSPAIAPIATAPLYGPSQPLASAPTTSPTPSSYQDHSHLGSTALSSAAAFPQVIPSLHQQRPNRSSYAYNPYRYPFRLY